MTAFPDQAATDYDQRIVRMVPGYELAQTLAAVLLAKSLGSGPRILVAGCGTGSEILRLENGLTRARYTAIDPSAGMLAEARRKITSQGFCDRVDFVEAALDTAPPTQHDAAIAFLVLHFLRAGGEKTAFLKAIAARLTSGSPLVLLDPANTGDADIAGYGMWLQAQGMPEAAAGAIVTRVSGEWHRATPDDLATCLQEAGFTPPQQFCSALFYRGLICTRV